MAKKKRKKSKKSKPKLKFKSKPAAYKVESTTCAPEIKLAIWGIIALVVVVVLVMYFTGML
ncbi:hypothetical protein GF343_05670 [Candidatus Woesearchaeota archaeon]|nr:hypothetical protein [Candidatus Woesearchaeota archaeon]